MVKKTATKKVKVPAKIVVKPAGFEVRRGSAYLGSVAKDKFHPDTWGNGLSAKDLRDIADGIEAMKS